MAKTVFTNQTGNIDVDTLDGKKIYASGPTLQVDVAGVLDGANFITYFKGAGNAKTPIEDCTWRGSAGEIPSGADGGTRDIHNREIGFEITNAGASTDLTVAYSVE